MGFSAILIFLHQHCFFVNPGIFWHVLVGNFGKIFGKFDPPTKGKSAVGRAVHYDAKNRLLLYKQSVKKPPIEADFHISYKPASCKSVVASNIISVAFLSINSNKLPFVANKFFNSSPQIEIITILLIK